MGEWTWLHVSFPLADLALTQPPLPPKVANVIVRTVRKVESADDGEPQYMLRVAPHNVAPFRGGPWTRVFRESDLRDPGEAMADFRERLTQAIVQVMDASK